MLQSKAGYIDARPLTASSAKPLATHGRTIHLGQSRHFDRAPLTSALPRLADILRVNRHVSKVPQADELHSLVDISSASVERIGQEVVELLSSWNSGRYRTFGEEHKVKGGT